MVSKNDFLKGLTKSVVVNDGRGPRLSNFHTGKKLNPILAPVILGGAVLAAGGLGTGTSRPRDAKDVTPLNALSLTRREVPPGEAAENPYTLADGTAGKAPTLGTNGSMVFGMHNKRNTGYL